ncbi:MAG: carbohydrate ABC transporter permease [Firmicutes bacterium]|nr:carbohydrate ABC transporter permease [Bacillota bacterium]
MEQPISSARYVRGIKERRRLSKVLAHIVLIGIGIFFFAPFLWMISTSLKPDYQIFRFPPEWIPKPPVWSNYPKALTMIPFLLYLKNTLTICLFVLIGNLISSSLVAYGFSRINWWGRDALFMIMLSTLMLPYQTTMIPLYITFRKIGWIGTFYPLIVPAFFGSAFSIFLLRQFFLTIPWELSDAARIDGCNEWSIFRKILLPLAKPALATVGLFTFLGSWNDFMGPLIYLTDESMYTLAVGLQQFQGRYDTPWSLVMAVASVMVIPTVILFFFAQRTFIQGITLTGMKG